MRNSKIVPALMFHSVGLEDHPWAWSYISEPITTFEAKIRLLSQQGFNGVFWEELYEYMAGRRSLPKNSILLTFDDGYLDNWVHVYPILKKYNIKGTIFVSPDFVDPEECPRPNSDDVAAGRCRPSDLKVAGFLSWSEMREMERSGLIDIQSHAMSHTWYFSGPEVVDFHRPHQVTPNPWLLWNARQDRKPYYLNEDQQEYLAWGYPLFVHEKSLVARRFFPDDGAIKRITDFVDKQGGSQFFEQGEWRGILDEKVAEVSEGRSFPGTYESDEDKRVRMAYELRRSKELIEENLEKTCEFICWPGGGSDADVRRLASEAGYKAWTLDSRSAQDKKNLPGTDPGNIKRIGTGNRIGVRGRMCGVGGSHYFLWRILQHQQSDVYSAALKGYKALALVRHSLRKGGIVSQ